jgi:superfamily I DNA/RNA helicase
MDPEKSPLANAGVKLKHPEPYSGDSDLEEFEGFIANILRWLKMNYLLGPTSTDLQVRYLGTCLTREAQEWFHRNDPRFDRQVRDWTLETVIQGLQKRLLHTLTYHHASNLFDAVMQGTKTVQEYMNELTKYAARMIQQLGEYTLRQRFVSVLRETLRNEVLKKGYNAETSSLDALCDTARMIEEASRYNQGMRRAEAASTAANAY